MPSERKADADLGLHLPFKATASSLVLLPLSVFASGWHSNRRKVPERDVNYSYGFHPLFLVYHLLSVPKRQTVLEHVVPCLKQTACSHLTIVGVLIPVLFLLILTVSCL